MLGVLHVLSQTLPCLQHFVAERTGDPGALYVVGLDVELDVLLHLGVLPALVADPAQHRVPEHEPGYSLLQL